jgi:hypothetical protein
MTLEPGMTAGSAKSSVVEQTAERQELLRVIHAILFSLPCGFGFTQIRKKKERTSL